MTPKFSHCAAKVEIALRESHLKEPIQVTVSEEAPFTLKEAPFRGRTCRAGMAGLACQA